MNTVKVMVIEDRVLTLNTIKKEVPWQEYGLEPIGFFESCDAAWPYIEQQQPDVVVTDIVMSGTDGLSFCQKLFDTHASIKIIIISAHSRFEYAQKALQLGVSDYLEKPLDYRRLAGCIRKAAEEKQAEERYREHIQKHRDLYAERFFTRLLSGTASASQQEMRREMELLKMPLPQGRLACVTFSMDQAVPEWDGEQQEVVFLRLFRHLRDNCRGRALFGPFYMSFNHLSAVMEETADAVQIAGQALSAIEESYGVAISAGIGQWYQEPEQLSQSYQESLQALEQRFIFGGGSVFCASDLPRDTAPQWSLLARYETLLLKHLGVGDYANVCKAVDALEGLFQTRYISRESLHFFCRGVLSKARLHEGMEGQMPGVAALDGIEHIDAYFACFKGLCRELCNDANSRFKHQHNEIAFRVRRHLEEAYRDEGTGLASAAREVNMSPNYVSTIFKRETGMGVAEYLTQVRVEEAKRLLRETHKRIGEISAEVGYASPYYFSMNFKKKTGYSPKEFRANTTGAPD